MSLRLLRPDPRSPAAGDEASAEVADPRDAASREEWEGHLLRGRQALEGDRFEDALGIYERGAELARRRGAHGWSETLRCSRAGVLVLLERGDEAAAELRRILLASTSTANRFLAAYNLSCHHDRAGTVDRAHFYAKQALDHARRAGNRDYVAKALNQLANMLVLESYFPAAGEAYEEALALLPETPSVARSLVLANLGYCRVVTGDLDDAFRLLFAGLRMMRRLGARNWEVMSRVRLSLAIAYLESERYAPARRHGETALAAAEGYGDTQAVKHALYLLGEIERSDDNQFAAFSHFSRLQREFYPDSPGVTDTLMVTATHKLINLMA